MSYCKKEKIIFIHVHQTGGTTLEHLFTELIKKYWYE
jgi:hypothetical protein